MPFLALQFDADGSAADAWADALLERGALSVDASDPAAGTAAETPLFAEPGVGGEAAWPTARLRALFRDEANVEAVLAGAAAALGRSLPEHSVQSLADADWVRATQSQFGPIRVCDGVWIVPTWVDPPDPAAINVRLDPGLAFGTGSHPTTRLCLEWLGASLFAGESVLDYGCGSGVLAIVAAKRGAANVCGTDVDPQAIVASVQNAERNGVAIRFAAPAQLPAGAFDVVVANILAGPLIDLAPTLAARVRAGGRLALSGILESQGDDVAAAYAPWFIIGAALRADGWVLLTGMRRGTKASAAGHAADSSPPMHDTTPGP